MNERFDAGGGEGEPEAATDVHALRRAYREGRLVVSGDRGDLARARLTDGHAIDVRDVADAMLREMLPPPPPPR